MNMIFQGKLAKEAKKAIAAIMIFVLGFVFLNANISINFGGADKANAATDPAAREIIASDTIQYSSDGWVDVSSDTYVKVKELAMTSGYTGSWRIKFDFAGDPYDDCNGTCFNYAQIYKNGVAYGILQGNPNIGYTTYSEDFTNIDIVSGDLIQLYVQAGRGVIASAQNFRIEFTDITPVSSPIPTPIVDATPTPISSPVLSPVPTFTPTPIPTPTIIPTPIPTPTVVPTPIPTFTPTPTVEPIPTPSSETMITSLRLSSSDGSVETGKSKDNELIIELSKDDGDIAVELLCENLPVGVSCVFGQLYRNDNELKSKFYIRASSSAVPGKYSIIVKAKEAGSESNYKTANYSLTVKASYYSYLSSLSSRVSKFIKR